MKNGIGRRKGCVTWNKGKKMAMMSGSKHPAWKGGTSLTGDGRTMIYKPSHKNARKNKYILLSVFNMSKKIGRPLKKGEIVHHIDGDRTNDNPKNLMLFKNISEHTKFHHRLLGHKKYNPSFRDPNEPVIIKQPKFFLKDGISLICEVSS